MSRMGRMTRSAKMKARTPPKLMPPFQSTAASGTFPIEQTKLTIATAGPISGPQNLAGHELPAEQQRHDDPELDDQVGRSDLERHRRGEVRSLAEERARERDRGVGAARGGCPETARHGDRLRRVVREQPLHLLFRDD